MLQSPRRRWPRILGGYVFLLGFLAATTTPVYLIVKPSDRPTVVRLSLALVVGILLIRLRQYVQERLDAQPASTFEAALRGAPPEPHRAPLFVKLLEEIRSSTRSQPYFERVLWPRIQRLLAGRAGQGLAATPGMPRGRRVLRRGPSLTALRDLIARIGERP
jgi:hypothetical protein